MDPPDLFIFDGATGAGKSTLLELLRNEYSKRILVGTKLTTRKRRNDDNDWEFRFVAQVPDAHLKYSFHSVGHEYALDIDALGRARSAGLVYAISCVDRQIVQRLRSDFSTVAVYVYRPWKENDFEALLATRGISEPKDVHLRMTEIATVSREYLEKVDLYDHVILNIGSEADVRAQLVRVMEFHGIERDEGRD